MTLPTLWLLLFSCMTRQRSSRVFNRPTMLRVPETGVERVTPPLLIWYTTNRKDVQK